jgi:diguanylate cyclase (GGDEF)-like protein
MREYRIGNTNGMQPTGILRKVTGRIAGRLLACGNLSLILVWPLGGLLLAAILWGILFSRLHDEKQALERQALNNASSLARAYAQQLTRAMEQVDQATLQVRHDWSQLGQSFRLEKMVEAGLFPTTSLLLVSVANQEGYLATASVPLKEATYVADREYFLYHKTTPSRQMRMDVPRAGRVVKRPVLPFTRRLDHPDGSFAGVAIVTVDPAFFLSFYERTSLGPAGMLAMLGKDGVARSSSIGDVSQPPERPALRNMPRFEADSGARLIADGAWFSDGRPRFVGWSTLDAYPVVAVVGLAREEVLKPYRRTEKIYLTFAVASAVFLFLSGSIAALLSLRLVRRRQESDKAREEYGIATEGGSEGFYMWRSVTDRKNDVVDFAIVDCNERGATFYGLNKAEILGRRLSSFYRDKALFERLMHTYRKVIDVGYFEDEYKVPPESPLGIAWLHRKMVRTDRGLALTIKDISEQKAHERELLRMANEDELTGLPNRQWLKQNLPAALERARGAGTQLALLFMDLNGFKAVNDTLGHSAGDELLQAAARRLRNLTRPSDSVIRFGGDEFTIIMENLMHENDAAGLAGRIADAFNQPFDLTLGQHTVGASIGITLFPRDGDDAESLLKNADIAMYSAKEQDNRRGRYQLFRPELYNNFKRRHDLERELEQALEQDQFVLFYQPRIDVASGTVCAMEALIRWLHPARGMVPPIEFIPLAESSGLILRIGDLVIDKACAQIAAWQREGVPLAPVSVNVSARQFNMGNVRDRIAGCLAQHGVAASLLQVELTESSMIGDHCEVSAQVDALRALGIRMLVDDFGTGYSSLSQLHRLNLDVLKVDKAFTAEVGTSPRGKVFFQSIISMAHALGMTVVAEGVETMAQYDILRALACDEAQGYLFRPPVPAAEMADMMRKRSMFPPAAADNRL